MLAFEFRRDKILMQMSSVCSLMRVEAQVCVFCVFSDEMDLSVCDCLLVCVCVCVCVCIWMFLSFSCGTCEPKCVCIVHLPVRVCVNFPAPHSPSFLLVGRRQGSERPAPRVILNPLLISFVCSSVRQRSVRDPGMRGVDLYPSPPNPTPPLSVAAAIHMQATRHPPILSFHPSTPGQAVVSRLKFKSWDRPGHPGPRQATTDQTWQAAGAGGGRGEPVFGCSFFIGGQGEMVGRCYGDGLRSHTGVSFTLTNMSVSTGDLICY